MRSLSAVLTVAGVAVAVVAGCSDSSPSSSSAASSASVSATASASSPTKRAGDPLPDPAALLKESSAATRELTSVHLTQAVVGKVPEMPVRSLKGDLTNEPSIAAKGNAKIMIMGSAVEVDFVVFGGSLYMASQGEAWRDYGPTAKVYDPTTILAPDDGLANLLTNFIDPKAEARETIEGQETIRVVGKVPADAVNKIVPQLDVTERMSTTVWIRETGERQVVQVNLEPSKDSSIQMALSNWNAPVTVDKPAGA